VTVTVPSGVAIASFDYVLRHGDDNLVLAQRLGEWIAAAPELELDIALANIAVDHLGVARSLLAYAADIEGAGGDEDSLAMGRSERQFTNLLLVEQPNGDFAVTIARQLFFDAYQVELWHALSSSTDPTLAGVAGKAVKEAAYHLRFSSDWVVRLGDGTEESHRRMQQAIDQLWRFTGEMLVADPVDISMAALGVGPDPATFAAPWTERVTDVLQKATLVVPDDDFARLGGRAGLHTEHLGHLLGEMQWMQRSYPGLTW
jgi:ring-1,2-phenylacetyl-CoA epoxidase subunit PaaC